MGLLSTIKKSIRTYNKISKPTNNNKSQNSNRNKYKRTTSTSNSSYSIGGTTYLSEKDIKKFVNIDKSSGQPKVKSSYVTKDSIMSECEKEYFAIFRELLPDGYLVQPQINLASVIDKETQSAYRNELFRNIDFGVFDSDYNLKLLIEINDNTHNKTDRIIRDMRVNEICKSAGVPLVEFWVKDGIEKDKIGEVLSKYIFDNKKEEILTCAYCGAKLVLRNGKNGEFYGCSNYPKCKFTKNI